MIYDFEKNVPEVHPEAWVASSATIIGKVKLESFTISLITAFTYGQ